jgi:hypothetical protein
MLVIRRRLPWREGGNEFGLRRSELNREVVSNLHRRISLRKKANKRNILAVCNKLFKKDHPHILKDSPQK